MLMKELQDESTIGGFMGKVDYGRDFESSGGEMAKKYTIMQEPNYPEEGYTVRVIALPGCITYGRTRGEALERAKEAIEGFIEGLQKAGEPIPEEVTPAELETVKEQTIKIRGHYGKHIGYRERGRETFK